MTVYLPLQMRDANKEQGRLTRLMIESSEENFSCISSSLLGRGANIRRQGSVIHSG